jgi:hypothetical protein
MTDNVRINEGSGPPIATREVTYSGEPAHMQVVGLATLAGPDDAKVPTDVSEANPLPVADTNSGNLLLRILQMLQGPLGYDKSQGRQRGTVVVESGTVTTVSNIAALGGYPAQMQIIDGARSAWALNVRSRIT